MNIDPRCTRHGDDVCCPGGCKPVTKLEDLVITEVSFVQDPSNYHSRVVLMKTHDDEYEPAPEGDTIQKEDTPVVTIQKYMEIEGQLADAYRSDDIQKFNAFSREDAERMLDEAAQALRSNKPEWTAEQSFAEAMRLLPSVASLAIGTAS